MDWTKFIDGAKSFALKGWTSYVLITLGLIALLAIVGITTKSVIVSRADKLTKTHVLDPAKQVECSITGSAEKANFVNAQRSEISAFGNGHRESAIEFFSDFYTTYLVFTIFGLIAAISLAVVAKEGISNASPHVVTVFLVCTAVVVLYQGAFGVFQHKANIESNAKLAVSYGNLADQIDTYCVTGKINVADPNEALAVALPKLSAKPANANNSAGNQAAPPESEKTGEIKIRPFYVAPTGDEFINYLAWQMEHLRSLSIAIDDTKVTAIDNKRFLIQ